MSCVLTTSARFSSASTCSSLAPRGHRELRVAGLDAHAPAVGLDLTRPHHLRVLGEQPVDEDLGRRGCGARFTSHTTLLLS
jgi:hypothetical protein